MPKRSKSLQINEYDIQRELEWEDVWKRRKMRSQSVPVLLNISPSWRPLEIAQRAMRCYEMRYEDENIWLTQKMMAALYDVSKQTISQHIQRGYDDGELIPEETVKKYLTV